MAAAAICCILEGPAQRAFMAMAEARDSVQISSSSSFSWQRTRGLAQSTAPPLRGFTTLSSSLGQAVVATHQGLIQAALSEAVPAVTQVTLRALCVLMAGSPYERLPALLLPHSIEVSGAVLRRELAMVLHKLSILVRRD